MSQSLEELLALIGRLVPRMQGQLIHVPQASPVPGGNHRQQAMVLRDLWAARHPEAGPHYLAVRCWGLLIWQPIYLSVIAVHRGNVLPDVGCMRQTLNEDGFIAGFSMFDHVPRTGSAEELRTCAAQRLGQVCSALRADLDGLVRLNARAAACVQADIVLHSLLVARQTCSGQDAAWLQHAASAWLESLGLAGRSGYAMLADGSVQVQKQVCCHHFLRTNGEHCGNCPKLCVQERQAGTVARAL